jgi:head-tail adaptor
MARYHLNRPLVLEAPDAASDGAGGRVLTWTPLGTLWAEMRPGAGRERLGPIAPEGSMLHRVYTRAAPQGSPQRPRPDLRFRDQARVFTILAVGEADAAGAYLVSVVREEVPA